MLFYASLFVVCFIVACVLFWMFRSLKEVGTAVYQAFLPSRKGNVKARRLAHLSEHLESIASPWGWDSSERGVKAEPHRLREQKTADVPAPWGWRGNQNKSLTSGSRRVGNNQPDKAKPGVFEKVRNTVGIRGTSSTDVKVGWPYREESCDIAGTQYKKSSKPKAGKIGSSKQAKPWGW